MSVKLGPEHGLNASPVLFTSLETGWLLSSQVWERAKEGDFIARSIYLKIKAAAIMNGVEWYYGDPWDIEADPVQEPSSET